MGRIKKLKSNEAYPILSGIATAYLLGLLFGIDEVWTKIFIVLAFLVTTYFVFTNKQPNEWIEVPFYIVWIISTLGTLILILK